ncbi:MAG: DUF1064 domain-containing protein [Bacilli bacterium]|nr:DUF1064 domain-containing protein [Bacilli bacterium]
MRISNETYKKLVGNSIDVKQNKYKNKKVVYDGIKFDSNCEMAYYIKLKMLEEKGIIKDLELQKSFELQPSFKLNGKTYQKITYKADFSYVSVEDNKIHIVDTKGFRTDVYKLKRKMFAYKYGIEIEEI